MYKVSTCFTACFEALVISPCERALTCAVKRASTVWRFYIKAKRCRRFVTLFPAPNSSAKNARCWVFCSRKLENYRNVALVILVARFVCMSHAVVI